METKPDVRDMGGEGDRIADRRYRENAKEFSEDFDPKDMGRLRSLAQRTKASIDHAIEDLQDEADEQVIEARRLLARALHDLGNRIAR